MATKNFASMTSKKLNALLETANEADAQEIRNILSSRGQLKEEAAEHAADSNDAMPAPESNESILEAEAERLKEKHVYHRCKVVPFGAIEYVEGTIISVIFEKRNKKIMYAVKLDDGRRILKSCNAKFFEILDDVNETMAAPKPKKERAPRTPHAKRELDPNWDANAEAAKHTESVGKLVDCDGNEARIVAIVPDKRSQRILYRVQYDVSVTNPETNEISTKTITAHKSANASLLESMHADDKTAEANAAYIERREKLASNGPSASYEQKLEKLNDRIKKAQEALEKLQAMRDALVAQHDADTTATNENA